MGIDSNVLVVDNRAGGIIGYETAAGHPEAALVQLGTINIASHANGVAVYIRGIDGKNLVITIESFSAFTEEMHIGFKVFSVIQRRLEAVCTVIGCTGAVDAAVASIGHRNCLKLIGICDLETDLDRFVAIPIDLGIADRQRGQVDDGRGGVIATGCAGLRGGCHCECGQQHAQNQNDG